MANILYLVHRMPYPPNKGDKVRSYHLLQHLREKHRVYLGTFIDDADDEQHLGTLRALCADACIVPLHPRRARVASLAGLATGRALTLHYYEDAGLRRWVRETAARERFDAVVVYSSSMVQYADELPGVPCLIDFVDVDSAKWTAYAERHAWPLSWVYRREGSKLLAYERAVARRARRSFFSTPKETELFQGLAPECRDDVEPLCNGVDADFFAPDATRPSPYAAGETALVFTGAMDYWPNIDAVQWFASEVMPRLREQRPQLRLYIVGRSPAPAVRALASEAVTVTGTVPDVRPYVQHAAVAVAPLRLARGVQNKVLEAMAMARPVVASDTCAAAIDALAGEELLVARSAEEHAQAVLALLDDPQRAARVGAAGRARVLADYGWRAHLSGMERHLVPPAPSGPRVAA